MIALGLLLVIIGAAVAVVIMSRSSGVTGSARSDRSSARSTPSSVPSPENRTFLSTQPTLFAVPEEQFDGSDIGPAPEAPPLHRSVPLFAEALGYIGGVLVIVALGVIVKEYWSDLGVAGRLAISAGAAGGLFGLGAILTVERDVALRRLRAFVWLASAAATGLLAGVIVVDLIDSDSERIITMAVAGAFAAQCGLLWRNRFRPLQQAGFTIGFAVFLGAVLDQFTTDGPIGAALWVFGVALVMGGLRRAIIDPTIAEIAGAAIAYAGCAFIIAGWMGFGEMIAAGVRDMVRVPLVAQIGGAVALIIGAAVCGAQNAGFAPIFGLLTAIALIALGTRSGMAIMSLFGSLALLINVPWLISHFFPGRGRAPFLILVSGLLIMGVAVLLARSGGRIRQEVGTRNRDLRHAA